MPSTAPAARPPATTPPRRRLRPVLHHDEVFADPQVVARGMVAEVQHAKAGKQKTLGVPIKMSANSGTVRRAAPTLWQHDEEIKRGEKRWSGRKASSPRSR